MNSTSELLLYNALSLLADKTYESFDNADDWLDWICRELNCSEKLLQEYGINRDNLRL